ncbi:MAG: BNR/Asp-box repeat protein [Gemmataceae bacterium]|nr:BNR/Asp-box repeat protein [Gemmataceae bacterium]
MRYSLLSCAFVFLIPGASPGADWKPVTAELVAKEKPGYGGLSGVVVDHATGHLFVDLSDRGVFRSTDRGKTWERLGKDVIKGRTETPGSFQIDPAGKTKRLLLPSVYGGPIAVGSAAEGGWRVLDKASVHVDWCAADWTDPDLKFLLTLKHESGGLLLVSRDGGKTFAEHGKGYGPAWAFDADTAVVAALKTRDRPKGGLLRTTDGGKTFSPAGDYAPVSLPRWHAGALYWLADGVLIKTADKGGTWEKLSAVKDGRFGPVSGKDGKHLFVLTGAGVVESTDGGATWSAPIAVPKELKGVSALTWLEYDPVGDVVYVMKMGSELYALPRGSK